MPRIHSKRHAPAHPASPTPSRRRKPAHATGHSGKSSFGPARAGHAGQSSARGGVSQYTAIIQQTAARYGLPPAYVAAVMDRETGGNNIIGDHGHGHGLMQIDDRSFAGWLHQHQNGLDPASNVDKGCELLKANLDAAHHLGLTGDAAFKFAASAYNAGLGGAEAGLKKGDSDLHTTGHNYGADVVARMHRWAQVL